MIARVLQGIGSALSVPVGRLIVLRLTEKSNLLIAIAYLTWPALAAPVLAPPLGGFIVEHTSWRWIFLINLPIGAIAAALAFWWMPRDHQGVRSRFDVTGFVLTALACVSLIYVCEAVGGSRTDPLLVAAGCVVAAVCGFSALRHLRRAPQPLLDLSTMRIKTFAVSQRSGSVTLIVVGATPFLLALMFQIGFGMNALSAGSLVMALFVGNMLMKTVTTPILRRFGFRRVLMVNGLLMTICFGACALLHRGTPIALIVALLFACGLSRSMQFTALFSLGYADVPQAQMSGAIALSSILQSLSMAMGVAFAALALRLSALVRGNHGDALLDYQIAFVVFAAFSLLAVLGYAGLPADAGAEVSRHRAR